MLRFAGAASALFLAASLSAQTAPSDWKTIKDAKGACKIDVPSNWTSFSEGSGAAIFHDPTVAIAVVTSQPGQAFKPLTDRQIGMMGIAKDKIFENSAKRLFYQDKVARNSDDTNALSSMVPGNAGTCSCHIVYVKDIPEDTAKKIALSVAPTEQQTSQR